MDHELTLEVAEKSMNSLEFIASIIKYTAWPILIAYLIPKIDFAAIVRFIKTIKYKDFEVTFGEKVEELEREIEEAGISRSQPNNNVWDKELYKMAEAHPDLAIIKAWKKIENEIQNILMNKLNDKIAYRKPFYKQIEELKNNNIVTPQIADLLRDVMVLRNRAVHKHDHNISSAQAYMFLELAAHIYNALPIAAENL